MHHQMPQSSRNNAEIWPTTEVNQSTFSNPCFYWIFIFFHSVQVTLIIFSDLHKLQKDKSYEQVGLGKLKIN